MEIERKFLTKTPPANLESYPHFHISQCYISKNPTVRIRKQNENCFLTVKGKGHMARQEFELPISLSEFENLLKKADPPMIEKTRYLLPLPDDLTAEVDVFHKPFEGLILTEVEFQSEKEANGFLPPLWFGEDVTYDSKYKNSNLQAGISYSWE